jgi:hypothetical protein
MDPTANESGAPDEEQSGVKRKKRPPLNSLGRALLALARIAWWLWWWSE